MVIDKMDDRRVNIIFDERHQDKDRIKKLLGINPDMDVPKISLGIKTQNMDDSN